MKTAWIKKEYMSEMI